MQDKRLHVRAGTRFPATWGVTLDATTPPVNRRGCESESRKSENGRPLPALPFRYFNFEDGYGSGSFTAVSALMKPKPSSFE